MDQGSKTPVRILHAVGGMNRGGVETWLMHVLRNIDRERFRMDFMVHTMQACAYDEEIRALGSKIIPCPTPSKPLQYAMNFKRILREHGPYDVIHSHVHHFSGFVVYLGRREGIPIRIAHSHNDTSLNDDRAGILRKGYLKLMAQLIRRDATKGLACSRQAAAALYGAEWESDNRWQVLYYGIDLEPFTQPAERVEVRSELGIPQEAFVLGHVGRFHEQKNHSFLIDIACEVAKRNPCMRLLLIGDGPLRPEIEHKVAQLGLTDKVIFAGLRSDVPRLMKGAMDVFVMPSLHEGLPVVTIEAQAANLAIILSDVVTSELDLGNVPIWRLNLDSSASDWANVIINFKESILDQIKDFSVGKASVFEINNSVQLLIRHY